MYEAITAIANQRVVTASDFAPYVCKWEAPSQYGPPISSFATFDADAYPVRYDDEQGEVVGEFFIRRIFEDSNQVEVGLVYVPYRGIGTITYVAVHMDADELAIRIEDS